MAASKLPTAAEILQRFYDAESIYMAAEPEKRDFANGMGKHLSPHMKLYQSPDLPTGGEYDGHRGFQDWSDKMASYFDRLVVDQPEVFEKEGSDFVLMRATLRLRARKTGEKWEKPLAQVIGVDRKNEYITEIRSFYWDVRGLNQVAGTLEKEPLKLL